MPITLFQVTTGFHYACEHGYTEIVKLLLARDDMDVTSKDRWGKTGFHFACQNGHSETVKLFLARDDVDVKLKCRVSQ